MQREIDFNSASNQDRKLARWFGKWGHRKWQFVLLHQLPVVAGWNVYWFFSDHNLSFYPMHGAEILQVVIRELPVLLVGIVLWTTMKIRNWNRNAFIIGVLNKKGKFQVEGTYLLNSVQGYTQARIEYLSNWYKRWSDRKRLFQFTYATLIALLIVFVMIGIKMWQKGSTWIDTVYHFEWPVYFLLIGLPISLAVYASREIWRRNEREYLSSFRFQNSGKE